MPISKKPFTVAEPHVPAEPAQSVSPMETAPQDGTVILLQPFAVPAKYKQTRRFIGGRWYLRGKWVSPDTGATLNLAATGWSTYTP